MLIYTLEHFGVAVNAIAGVLAARGRQVDLFGVIVLALVTAFGGGTIRDLCLGATPVFWIQDARYLVTALVAAAGTFFVARWMEPPRSFMEGSDAIGLAMFTIIGAQKSLIYETGGLVAVAMGTMTGVAGGIVRDVLLNELPMVFRKSIRLYATAAIAGAVVYVLLKMALPRGIIAALTGSAVVLAVRLAAMRWELVLPEFRTRK